MEDDEDEMVLVSMDSYGRVLGTSELGLDFSFKSYPHFLRPSKKLLKELQLDCRYVDSELFDNTFWMPARGKPRFSLEALALSIFKQHASSLINKKECEESYIDWANTGIEWWVQHVCDDNLATVENGGGKGKEASRDCGDIQLKHSIGFHWDKDEELRIRTGVYVHAAVSTVTYLSAVGPPTLVLEQRIKANGKLPSEEKIRRGFVSYPRVGKHIVFDARYLHAVPRELHLDAQYWENKSRDDDDNASASAADNEGDTKGARFSSSMREGTESCATTSKSNKRQRDKEEGRKGRQGSQKQQKRPRTPSAPRVTFLANVWVNHKPVKVCRFPQTGLQFLTKNRQFVIHDGKANVTTTSTVEGSVSIDSTIATLMPKMQLKGRGQEPIDDADDAASSSSSPFAMNSMVFKFGITGNEYELTLALSMDPDVKRHIERYQCDTWELDIAEGGAMLKENSR
mmetsp:Transcript_5328/g.7492  ORF Transcript_5328/g.7492 Transcript_5328/m.7492 type:complete len:457 (-) Transcript_5328:83-1453(-)